MTKEELWTTALLAYRYGAAGVSAFNFVYTRPYFDLPCEFELNKPCKSRQHDIVLRRYRI